MKVLMIDDMPETKSVFHKPDYIALNFGSGMVALSCKGPWDILYLDHDLGDPNPKHTGYQIMCWLEENQEFLPGEIILTTRNPVGRKGMQTVIDRLYGGKQ